MVANPTHWTALPKDEPDARGSEEAGRRNELGCSISITIHGLQDKILTRHLLQNGREERGKTQTN